MSGVLQRLRGFSRSAADCEAESGLARPERTAGNPAADKNAPGCAIRVLGEYMQGKAATNGKMGGSQTEVVETTGLKITTIVRSLLKNFSETA